MPLINIPGPGEKLRTNYALNQPPDPTLAPEIVPVVIVDDFSDPGASGRDAMGFISHTAAAGSQPVIALVANATSSRRYIIKRITAVSNSNDTLIVSFPLGVTGLVEQLTRSWKDPRGVEPGRPSLFTGAGNSAALTVTGNRIIAQIGLQTQLGTTVRLEDLGIVLQAQPPAGPSFYGRTLLLSTLVAAQGLHVTVEWNELDQKA